jgi:hypothetical protein
MNIRKLPEPLFLYRRFHELGAADDPLMKRLIFIRIGRKLERPDTTGKSPEYLIHL